MTTAKQLISSRVVIGFPEQRLAYLADKIKTVRAQYCVILEGGSGNVIGLVNFADLASNPSTAMRIFADLMQPPPLRTVLEDRPFSEIEAIFSEFGLQEITVLSVAKEFIGLITPESYCQFLIKLRTEH